MSYMSITGHIHDEYYKNATHRLSRVEISENLPRTKHIVYALLCFDINQYPSDLLHWYQGPHFINMDYFKYQYG